MKYNLVYCCWNHEFFFIQILVDTDTPGYLKSKTNIYICNRHFKWSSLMRHSFIEQIKWLFFSILSCLSISPVFTNRCSVFTLFGFVWIGFRHVISNSDQNEPFCFCLVKSHNWNWSIESSERIQQHTVKLYLRNIRLLLGFAVNWSVSQLIILWLKILLLFD